MEEVTNEEPGRNQLRPAKEEEAEEAVWLEGDAAVEEKPKEQSGKLEVDASPAGWRWTQPWRRSPRTTKPAGG